MIFLIEDLSGGFVFISPIFTLLHFMEWSLNASIYKPTFHYWSLCLFTCHCQFVPLCLFVLLFVKSMIYEYVAQILHNIVCWSGSIKSY